MSNLIKKFISKFFLVKSEKLYHSVTETAAILRVSKRAIYGQIKQKKTHAIQIEKGGNYRISRDEIERLKNNNGRV